MTNEEIHQKVKGLCWNEKHSQYRNPTSGEILQLAYELVLQAYEEAAQAAENQLGVSGHAYAEDEHRLIAQYIRSLKDSLQPDS